MKYMYTNKPDESCHQIKGVHGRPVNTYEQKALKAAGWVYNPNELTKSEPKKESKKSCQYQRRQKL